MPKVNIEVNGEKVPLNDFMEEMLKNLVLAYLKAAKGIPEDIKSINVEIEL